MKKLIIILMIGCLFAQESPCEDATYLELKKKQLDEMSEREYQYFTTKDTACEQWKLNQQKLSKIVIEKQAETYYYIIGGIITVVLFVGIFY